MGNTNGNDVLTADSGIEARRSPTSLFCLLSQITSNTRYKPANVTMADSRLL